MAATIAGCPAGTSALAAVEAGFHQVATEMFPERGDWALTRQQIIEAHPELQERELLKMAALADRVAAALRARGEIEPIAGLAAESGVAVFKIAFARWLEASNRQSLAEVISASFADLRTVTA